MNTLILRLALRHWGRLALWGLGLLLVTAGVILTATLSRSAVVVVEEDLSRSWRTSYDILVRPTGSRNPIEEDYGLVEANFTSGLRGGISLEQVQAIREIPEVEVAAPIAVLGYISTILDPTYQTIPAQGVYLLERSLVVDEGPKLWEDTFGMYVYSGPVPPDVLHSQDRPEGFFYAESATYRNSHPSVYLLLAAIDPEQEALLLNLDQTLRQGEYLSGEERLGIRHEDTSSWPPEMRVTNPLTTVTNVPILINATPYVHFTSTIRITQINLPAEVPPGGAGRSPQLSFGDAVGRICSGAGRSLSLCPAGCWLHPGDLCLCGAPAGGCAGATTGNRRPESSGMANLNYWETLPPGRRGTGSIGGGAGSGLGLVAFLALYRSLSLKLLGIALLGVALSGLLGVIAAVYPARVAATVSPAEAMRGE